MTFKITLTCQGGHEQVLYTQGMAKAMALDYAALLDGTSDFFVHPPLPDSRLHKCCYPGCGRPFTAAVEEIDEVSLQGECDGR